MCARGQGVGWPYLKAHLPAVWRRLNRVATKKHSKSGGDMFFGNRRTISFDVQEVDEVYCTHPFDRLGQCARVVAMHRGCIGKIRQIGCCGEGRVDQKSENGHVPGATKMPSNPSPAAPFKFYRKCSTKKPPIKAVFLCAKFTNIFNGYGAHPASTLKSHLPLWLL